MSQGDPGGPVDVGSATAGQGAIGWFAEPSLIESGRRMKGVHAGAIVFAGVAAANAGNAVFHLVAGRWLGPTSYGDLASLLALLGLVSFPLGAVQIALAQRVAGFAARREAGAIRSLYRRTLLAGLLIGLGLTLLMSVTAPLIGRVLDVDSTVAVVLAALTVAPAAVAPVISGLAQGLERFVLFAGTQAAAPLLRILWLVPLLALGAGVAGAVSAILVASVFMILLPGLVLAGWLRSAPRGDARETLRHFSASLVPTVAGILAFTSLTTVDVIVAKLAFADRDAGIYGGASLVGRLILYVPAAIAAVLLPKVSSRVALGARTTDILNGSLVATAGFCLLATLVYTLAPELVLSLSFGSEYEDAVDFLWLFGIAMTGFALVNVLFVYDLGRGGARMAWLLCAGAVVQLAAFALVHGSPEALLAVDIAVAFAVLAVGRLALRAAS